MSKEEVIGQKMEYDRYPYLSFFIMEV